MAKFIYAPYLPNLCTKFSDARKTQVEIIALLEAILLGVLREVRIGPGRFRIKIKLCDSSEIPIVNAVPIKNGDVEVWRVEDDNVLDA